MAVCAKEVVPAQVPLHKGQRAVPHKVARTARARSRSVHKLEWSGALPCALPCAHSCAPCAHSCAQGHQAAQGPLCAARPAVHKVFSLCATLRAHCNRTRSTLCAGGRGPHKAVHKPTDFREPPCICTYIYIYKKQYCLIPCLERYIGLYL